jgi:hypothetical protein
LADFELEDTSQRYGLHVPCSAVDAIEPKFKVLCQIPTNDGVLETYRFSPENARPAIYAKIVQELKAHYIASRPSQVR